MLSQKAKKFRTSPTLKLAGRAREMKERGEDVISLTVGEPDWPTYTAAAEAGVQSIYAGKTKYTPPQGILPLRKAIATLTEDLIGIKYSIDEITVSSGAKIVLYSALQTLLDNRDEVIIPTPFWASYSEIVELAGGTTKVVKTQPEHRFKITPQGLEAHITPQTKIFLLNSPCNPTGVEYSHEELRQLAEVLKRYPKVITVFDDIYNQLSFTSGQASPHLLQVAPELKERVICINGVSKAYSMTGWRIGWATGPKEVIHAMGSFQSQIIGSPNSTAQEAAIVAILECKADVAKTNEELKQRANYAIKAFSSIPGFKVLSPDAAFYLWIDVQEVLKKFNLKTAQELTEKLIEEQKVVVVPGDDFGDPSYIRISFATKAQDIDHVVERIKRMLA